MRIASVWLAAVLIATTSGMAGGRLRGTVWREDGRDVWMADMVAFQTGETQGVVETWTTSVYTYGDIPGGTYCLFNDDASVQLPLWVDGVVAVDNDTRDHDITVKGLAYNGKSQDTWPYPWVYEFGQTFLATGTSVTGAQVKIAGAARDLLVSVLEDGPGGTQLGPDRAIYLERDKSGIVYWQHGEVPTVPGKRYYLKVVSEYGSLCQSYADNPGRLTYLHGEAWGEGVAYPDQDMAGYVVVDTDGLRSTLRPVDYGNYMYTPDPPVPVVMTQYAAQCFTAQGAMIVGAACPVEYAGGLSALKFTIREGGPDGAQVGPAKSVLVGSGKTAKAAWREGECPVTAGLTYAVRVEPVPLGTSVTVQKLREQHATSMWLDGAEITYGDFYCKVFEYDGYDPLTITNIRVTPDGPGTVTVSWDTDAPAMSQVEYRSLQEPVDTITDLDETLVTEHAVAVSGLSAGHTYRFICKSYAPGHRWTIADAVTVDADEPASFAWTLGDGWNLVGLTDRDVPIADCRLDNGMEEKAWNDAVAAGWVQDGIFYYTGSAYGMTKPSGGDDDRVRDTLGYWVLNQSGGALTMMVP